MIDVIIFCSLGIYVSYLAYDTYTRSYKLTDDIASETQSTPIQPNLVMQISGANAAIADNIWNDENRIVDSVTTYPLTPQEARHKTFFELTNDYDPQIAQAVKSGTSLDRKIFSNLYADPSRHILPLSSDSAYSSIVGPTELENYQRSYDLLQSRGKNKCIPPFVQNNRKQWKRNE